MKEIKLNKDNALAVIRETIKVIEKGGTIIYPTETSYGLGGDFYNQKAIKKIYKIKGRGDDKPLPIIVPDLLTATTLVHFPRLALELAAKHWPGPLTLVLPYRYCGIDQCFEDFLALRISSHHFVSELLSHLAAPIISTSANLSTRANIYTPQAIRKSFAQAKFQPDLFINVGNLPKTLASTIIKVDKENKASLLRAGALKIKI
ncbi:threonylcarbamoyl-AMP synthase [Candidatus Nomurabacteria bacterium]|nr:threonylcarbamoyl-AMP synthase [Candidatus Nomurabacteria bacterium]